MLISSSDSKEARISLVIFAYISGYWHKKNVVAESAVAVVSDPAKSRIAKVETISSDDMPLCGKCISRIAFRYKLYNFRWRSPLSHCVAEHWS